jgi:hypothetical protein
VSHFRPVARATAPDGRLWEIYRYRVRRPPRGGRRRLAYLFADLPRAAVRDLRSDEWTIEAVSWAPYPIREQWTTSREYRGQVLASIEGQLARGETPMPRNARRIS